MTLVSLVEEIGSLIVADALTVCYPSLEFYLDPACLRLVGASPLPLLADYPTRSKCFLKVFIPPIYPPVIDPITDLPELVPTSSVSITPTDATTVEMPTAPPPSSTAETMALPTTEPCTPTPEPTIPSAAPSDHIEGPGSSGTMGSSSPGPMSSMNPALRTAEPPRLPTPLFFPERSPLLHGTPLAKRVSLSKDTTSPIETAIPLPSTARSIPPSTKTDLICHPRDFTPLASEDEMSGMLSMDPPPPRPSQPLPIWPGPSTCKSTGGKHRATPDTAIMLMGWLAYPKDEVLKGLKSLVRPDSHLTKSEWKFILCLAKWGVSYS
ncbi:hypothetical protein NEOLEDRAFT_1184775 [Neolentinus lepideus HHB14362 ss-1]|uniref:Uncharacterized protein n=1 Tax=Neolentinus lepideus HHB14362 ss-1 TaxID=1314782 RepID=A0A165M6C2_9AGAM|nr:hypothetical protein NEOLEDRAFT_1184775 [Neolentinus lepideus HHB14362 ss-1]